MMVLVPYTPNINKDGWVTFNNRNLEACIIKSNGDSLRVLASAAFYPQWDFSGQYIYFYRAPLLMKINSDGSGLETVPTHDMVGDSKTSNRILRVNYEAKELLWRDMDTGKETLITTRDVRYDFLTIDNKDENIYWVDKNIYSMNLNTLEIDTVLKTLPKKCEGDTTIVADGNIFVSATYISPGSNKLTFVYRVFVPVNDYKRYTKCYGLQVDLSTGKVTDLRIFE